MRWQERDSRRGVPGAARRAAAPPSGPLGGARGARRGRAPTLAGYRSVWDAPEVEFSPALEFLLRARAREHRGAAADAHGGERA